jgi:YD repeat-containing protein
MMSRGENSSGGINHSAFHEYWFRLGRLGLSSVLAVVARRKAVNRWTKSAVVKLRVVLVIVLALSFVTKSVDAQWDAGGSEEDYAQTQANQYWEYSNAAGEVTKTTLSPLFSFTTLSDNDKFFVEHGFAAWAEYQAPFENYAGNDLHMARFTPSEFYTREQDAVYEMGNQPPYTAHLGPVPFTFQGGIVRMIEGGTITGSDCTALYNFLYAYSGWANDATRTSAAADGSGAVSYNHAWLKGYLTRHVVLINSGPADSCGLSWGDYVYRYQYHAPGGAVINFYQRPGETATRSSWSIGPCNNRTETRTPEPVSYWSDDGSAMLDTSRPCKPMIRWSDGSLEEFHAPQTVEWPASAAGNVAHWYDLPSDCNLHADLRITDGNGDITRYTFTPTTESAIDVWGRETKVTFQPSPNTPGFMRLLSVEVPAPGGATPLKYQVNWRPSATSVNFAAVWPDVHCHNLGGNIAPCGTSSIDVVDSITIPDGRSYTFAYTPWGSLDTVAEPNGAVRKYSYGDSTNTTYAQNALPLINRVEYFNVCGALWSGETVKVQARGVTSESVYPLGTSGEPLGPGTGVIAETTNISYEKVDLGGCQPDPLGAATTGPDACVQVWKVITNPDGSRKKVGMAARSLTRYINSPPLNSGPPSPHGWDIGTEVWAPGGTSPSSATYNGDKTTGQLYYDFEIAATLRMPLAAVVDRRPSKVVGVKDGVIVTTASAYNDTIDIDPGAGVVMRNTKNVSKQCVWSGNASGCQNGSGTKMAETNTTFYHPDAYLQRNILRLPATQTLTDPQRGLLTRTDYNYDEYALAASGSVNLDTTVGTARGNVTTTTSYRSAANATLPISSHKFYFDTGNVKQNIDANGNTTTMGYDFGLCSTTHKVLTSTVNSPLVNGKVLVTTTASDCSTGLILRVTDANNQSSYTQYDNVGRVVETAGPGDTLTPLAGFLRDPGAPLNSGATVGNGGQGPTTWTEYLSLGAVTPLLAQRVVAHVKDGTADGSYVKTIADGLGRTRQTRNEVDPATSGGNAEVVATTAYDLMGRVQKSYVTYFTGSGNSYAPAAAGALFTLTEYDTLGRTKRVTPPGLPATITDYSKNVSANEWLVTVTDAKGNQTQNFADVLGRTIRVAQQSDTCTGGWCVTVMDYDAAGRLLRTLDPASNQLTFTYDGLGRKKHMTDPDMSAWDYDYDANGNLTLQIDAKGQIIQLSYDALNRITRKDLPPNGLSVGLEDTTYFYDGTPTSP